MQKYLIKAGSIVEVQQSCRNYDSGPITILLKRACVPIIANVVLVGDAAGSGSPVGGMGASLAMSAYPAALQRLVRNMCFQLEAPLSKSKPAHMNYIADIADIVDLFHSRSTKYNG